MNFKAAEAIEQATTAKRFWLLMSNTNTIHLYECKAVQAFGRWGHYRRFAGWKDKWGNKQAVRCYTAHKPWEPFWLASELTRQDWDISILSNDAKILLTQRENYSKIYKR